MKLLTTLEFNALKDEAKYLREIDQHSRNIIKLHEKQLETYKTYFDSTEDLLTSYRELSKTNNQLIEQYKTKLKLSENIIANYELLEQQRSEELMKDFDKITENKPLSISSFR